jgi:hypothetical protein
MPRVEFRTYYPSMLAGEDNLCLRLRSPCDQYIHTYTARRKSYFSRDREVFKCDYFHLCLEFCL